MVSISQLSAALSAPFRAIYEHPKEALAGAVSITILVGGYYYQNEVSEAAMDLLNEVPSKEELAISAAKSAAFKVVQAGALVVLAKLGDQFIHSSAGKYCAETRLGKWIDKNIISWIPNPTIAQRAYQNIVSLGEKMITLGGRFSRAQ